VISLAVEDVGYSVPDSWLGEEYEEKDRVEKDLEKVKTAKRRVYIAWSFVIPMMAIIISNYAGYTLLQRPYHDIVLVALATPVLFYVGSETMISGTRSLVNLTEHGCSDHAWFYGRLLYWSDRYITLLRLWF